MLHSLGGAGGACKQNDLSQGSRNTARGTLLAFQIGLAGMSSVGDNALRRDVSGAMVRRPCNFVRMQQRVWVSKPAESPT